MAATTWERGQDTVLIGTIFVSVSIKVADITVGIATIKSIGSKSTSKAISAAKMPAMETTVELMESSAAEAAAPKSTAEGACMEPTTEAAAMESSTAMAAAPPEPTLRDWGASRLRRAAQRRQPPACSSSDFLLLHR